MSERPFADFKDELLYDAGQDITGVYEAWWAANTWYPDRPLSERLAVAERAVGELLAEGLIALYRGTWTDALEHPVAPAEHEAVLRDWRTWVIPEGPEVFIFAPER